jgi:hypothetical protein
MATYAIRTLVIPDDSYADLYAVFYDLFTGDMYDSDGAVSTTWGDCAIVAARHASNNAVWIVVTPAIELGKNIGVNLFQNASPADTDVPIKAIKYDPKTNVTYSDAVPAAKGRAR